MAALAFPRSFFDCQRATLAARARTGDSSIGTQVDAGRVRVVSVTYPNRRSFAKVEPLSGWLAANEAIAFLNAMGSQP